MKKAAIKQPARPDEPGTYLVSIGNEDHYVVELRGKAPFMSMWWAIRKADGKMWGSTATELFDQATGWKKLE